MRGERLAKAFWILFCLVLGWPLIGVADAALSVLGIPLLLLYTFFAWAVLVAVLAVVARMTED